MLIINNERITPTSYLNEQCIEDINQNFIIKNIRTMTFFILYFFEICGKDQSLNYAHNNKSIT